DQRRHRGRVSPAPRTRPDRRDRRALPRVPPRLPARGAAPAADAAPRPARRDHHSRVVMARYEAGDLHLAASAGVRAPSLHNSQPWLFRLADGAIEILADPARSLPAADHGGWATRIACGAATYNARLALTAAGRPPMVQLHPSPGVIARLTPKAPRPPTYAE